MDAALQELCPDLGLAVKKIRPRYIQDADVAYAVTQATSMEATAVILGSEDISAGKLFLALNRSAQLNRTAAPLIIIRTKNDEFVLFVPQM